MAKYAAFLRAVNLGPTRKISSADLRAAFEKVGFADVQTFRTSGNVVFEASGKPNSAQIEQGLAAVVGGDVPVYLRTEKEIKKLAGHDPFPPKLVAASDGKLQVVLLSKKPAPAAQKEVLALATDADRLAFGARELFWLPSGGVRNSALDFKAIEKRLGPATMRTMGTIEQLAQKFFA